MFVEYTVGPIHLLVKSMCHSGRRADGPCTCGEKLTSLQAVLFLPVFSRTGEIFHCAIQLSSIIKLHWESSYTSLLCEQICHNIRISCQCRDHTFIFSHLLSMQRPHLYIFPSVVNIETTHLLLSYPLSIQRPHLYIFHPLSMQRPHIYIFASIVNIETTHLYFPIRCQYRYHTFIFSIPCQCRDHTFIFSHLLSMQRPHIYIFPSVVKKETIHLFFH